MRLVTLICLLIPLRIHAGGPLELPQLEKWQPQVEAANDFRDSLHPMLKLARLQLNVDRPTTLSILTWAEKRGIPRGTVEEAEYFVIKGLLARGNFHSQKAIDYLRKAIEVYRTLENDEEAARLHFIIAYPYTASGDRESAKIHWQQGIDILTTKGELLKMYTYFLRYFKEYIQVNEYANTKVALEHLTPKLQAANARGLIAITYKLLSNYHKEFGRYERALSLLDSASRQIMAVPEADHINRYELLCDIYLLKGWNYRYLSQYDSAIYAFRQGVDYGEKSGNSESYSNCLKGLGNIFEIQGDYDQAYKWLIKALELDKMRNDKQEIAWVYNALGNVYEGKGNNTTALDYYRKAVHLNDSIGHFTYATFKMDLAGIYQKLDRVDEAIGTLLEGTEFSGFLQSAYEEKVLYLGRIYVADRQYNKAFRCFTAVLQRKEMKEEARMKAAALLELGALYLQHRSEVSLDAMQRLGMDGAEAFFLKAQSYAASTGLIRHMARAKKQLSDFYRQEGRFDKALSYLDEYVVLHDSLVVLKSRQTVESLQARHEIARKENELALLRNEYEVSRLEAQNATEAKKRNLLLWLGSVLLLLVVGGGLFFRYRHIERDKRRRLREREAIKVEAQKKLEHAKTKFFSNITHEFKTPIALLQSPLQQLLQNEKDTGRMQYLKIMERNSERLLQLVNQLLDVNKLENRMLELHPHYGDMAGFLRRIGNDFETFAKQKGLEFSLDLPEHPIEAVFDSERLEMVMFNLISNAIKFTPKGGSVTVALEQKRDDRVLITIKDTGSGISEEAQAHIFNRFYQQDKENGNAAGTGLGLAISRELVQLHKGTISVESREGQGTAFTVDLPLFALQVATEITRMESTLAKGTSVGSSGAAKRTILIIDDNADLRRVLRKLLEDQYSILQSRDGNEGLMLAQNEIPDLIISDVMMPGMDGLQMLDELRKDDRTSHIPFIFLTAKGRMQHKLKGLQSGAEDYLAKPFNNEELLLKVHNLLQRIDQLKKRFDRTLISEKIPDDKLTQEEQFIQKTSAIIHEHLADPDFNVDMLSASLHMSRSQLYRKLNAITGKGPKTFIRIVRLTEARNLLQGHNLTVSEVCYKVGFSNPSYFSSAFKKEFGASPMRASQR